MVCVTWFEVLKYVMVAQSNLLPCASGFFLCRRDGSHFWSERRPGSPSVNNRCIRPGCCRPLQECVAAVQPVEEKRVVGWRSHVRYCWRSGSERRQRRRQPLRRDEMGEMFRGNGGGEEKDEEEEDARRSWSTKYDLKMFCGASIPFQSNRASIADERKWREEDAIWTSGFEVTTEQCHASRLPVGNQQWFLFRRSTNQFI